MGCDIHTYAEKRENDRYVLVAFTPFDWRDYGLYAFLAGVRNYSAVPPIAAPRGLPSGAAIETKEAAEDWEGDGHTHSFLTIEELTAFDYDAEVEDRRYTKRIGPNSYDGGATAEPGHGTKTTRREFLGPAYFRDLEELGQLGADRVVFWFDN